jgi:hypothetical protein
MHPALIQQMALERTAALYADARARRFEKDRPRRPPRLRAAFRALRPAHA